MLRIDNVYEISPKVFNLTNAGEFETYSIQIYNPGKKGYRGYPGKIVFNGYYFPNNQIKDDDLIGVTKGKSYIGHIEYTPGKKYNRRIKTQLYAHVDSEELIKLMEKDDIQGLKNIVLDNCYFY